MKWLRTLVVCLGLSCVLCAWVSCGGDDSPSGPSAASICFSVDGFNVRVSNMWRNGGTYSTNVQGLLSFTETVSQSGETHSLEWSNIVNNNTTRTVTSFTVRIDGRTYSYPANRC